MISCRSACYRLLKKYSEQAGRFTEKTSWGSHKIFSIKVVCYESWLEFAPQKCELLGQKKSLVSGLRLRPARRHFLFFIFLNYETMSNCSQNSWINWNSVMLCFKRLFHIGVWTFARFVRPLLATILCIWELWSLRIYAYIYVSRISLLTKKKHVTAPILTNDQKPETFWWPKSHITCT